VQNDVSDLLSLLSFLMPNVFSRQKCKILVEALRSEKSTRKHQKQAASSSSTPSSISISHLRGMLAPFVLRRIKSNVLNQLVNKTTVIEKRDMTAFQKKVYDNVIMGYALRKANAKRLQDEKIARENEMFGEFSNKKKTKKKGDGG
jgi:SWI/SNF-related matrix-associated actin-dependent regulator 1 of chromatin subfamily A